MQGDRESRAAPKRRATRQRAEQSHESPPKRRRRPKSEEKSPFVAIPGVGASHLYELGFEVLDQLKSASPEDRYVGLCKLRGGHVDRCVLYVFRYSVYFARMGVGRGAPALLKWHMWSDANLKRIMADPGAHALSEKDLKVVASIC